MKNETLSDLLESKKCIKIICGAGNENIEYIKKLVRIYMIAGARYFDLSPNAEVLNAVKSVFNELGTQGYTCISYGISGDPHTNKAGVDPNKCNACGKCISACIQDALSLNGVIQIKENKCVGCGECVKACQYNALSVKSKVKPIHETLPDLIKIGIDSVELHISSQDSEESHLRWKEISACYDGIMSVCIDRSNHSDIALKEKLNALVLGRGKYTTIIQADGMPMSGNNDKASTTLQSIAIAQIVNRMNLPVYVLLSGGTNNHTTKYAKEFDIDFNGISLGSFARAAVKKYLIGDIWDENAAVEAAKDVVETSLKYMEQL
jgi:ferredoxin